MDGVRRRRTRRNGLLGAGALVAAATLGIVPPRSRATATPAPSPCRSRRTGHRSPRRRACPRPRPRRPGVPTNEATYRGGYLDLSFELVGTTGTAGTGDLDRPPLVGGTYTSDVRLGVDDVKNRPVPSVCTSTTGP